MKKRVEVAAGILIDKQGRILLAKRAVNQHQGNKWEFPGGKIEANESPEQALCRELREELGVQVVPQNCQAFQHLNFDYADKQVSLHFFCIRTFQGQPQGLENQPLLWVNPADSDQYNLPTANQPIMTALKAHLQN